MSIFVKVFLCLFIGGIVAYGDEFHSEQSIPQISIEFFFRHGCKECAKVKRSILPKLAENFKDKYKIKYCDLDKSGNYIKLTAYQEYHQSKVNAPVYIVVNFSKLLCGYDDINNNIVQAFKDSLHTPKKTPPFDTIARGKLLQKRVQKFTYIAVLIAGLIDGINPCVFATLIFFISLLSISKVKGRRLLLTGATYCLACFLTYLALGIGLFNFLAYFSGYTYLRKIFELVTVAFLMVFALLSFLDAVRYKKSHKADQVKLQLPGSLKMKIHAVMRNGLKYRYFLPGVFGIGLLVTVIESVCTGQVYVPTLVLLTNEYGAGIWVWYLLLYNFAFIIPLIIVFIIAWHGANTLAFVNWSKRQLVYSKIALGVFFVCLAVALLLI